MSFGQAIIDGLRAAGPREVLVRGSRRLTGQDVLAMVSGAARSLEAGGVRPGDAIAFLNGRGPESVIGRLVAFALDCPAIQVLPGLPVEVAAETMRALRATAVLYEPDRKEEADRLLAACPVPVHRSFDDLLDHPGTRPVTLPATRPEDLSSVTFTNGTTGDRKAVAYSHRAEVGPPRRGPRLVRRLAVAAAGVARPPPARPDGPVDARRRRHRAAGGRRGDRP